MGYSRQKTSWDEAEELNLDHEPPTRVTGTVQGYLLLQMAGRLKAATARAARTKRNFMFS